MINRTTNAVLFVDDDPLVLQMIDVQLKHFLPNDHIHIELIANPVEVIKRIEQLLIAGFKIPFLFGDYQMPKMNGYELIYAVKMKYPDIECTLLSGRADKFQVRELFDRKLITKVINKPWKLNDIRNIINKLLSL